MQNLNLFDRWKKKGDRIRKATVDRKEKLKRLYKDDGSGIETA